MEVLETFDRLEKCIAAHCKKEDRKYRAHFSDGPNGRFVEPRMACLHRSCRALVAAAVAAMVADYKGSVSKNERLLKAEKDAVRRRWIKSTIEHAKAQLKRLSKIDAKKLTAEDVKEIMLAA